MEEIKVMADENVAMFLIGCKSDLENDRKILWDDAISLTKKFGFLSFGEFSSTEGCEEIPEFFKNAISTLGDKGMLMKKNAEIEDKGNAENPDISLKNKVAIGDEEDKNCKC